MAKLTFEVQITEPRGNGSYSFSHPVNYLRAGSYKGNNQTFEDLGGGAVRGYDNQLAAWKTVSLAIQGTRSLSFVMPKDPEIEKFYRKHTELADALKSVTIAAFSSSHPRAEYRFNDSPDQSIAIFDVTVAPEIFTIKGTTAVGMLYSGATKEWF